MQYKTIVSSSTRQIALVAHDNKKASMLKWVGQHLSILSKQVLYATGTTGSMLSQHYGIKLHCLLSGPMGGDQQVGALIAEEKIDLLIFFLDPLEPQPHDPDVKALLRLAAVWNIPVACNVATADMLINSPLIKGGYARQVPDYEMYQKERFSENIVSEDHYQRTTR